jgi:molecular chaperone Hsp33
MSDTLPAEEDPSIVEVHALFVRKRNALLLRADFGPLFMDYYLHLMQHGLKHEPDIDAMLKELLACMTLHLCSRPHDETCAWTLHFERLGLNFFATGSTRPGEVTGRLFTEDIRQMGKNMFISQTTRPGQDARQSMVEFVRDDVLQAAEQFYAQSEQRPARFFRGVGDEVLMLSAQPDCDLDWLVGLTDDDMENLGEREYLSPLEVRRYIFACGCSPERLYPLLQRLPADDLAYIFADGVATVKCPRCAAVFDTPREVFEAWLSKGQA